MAQLDTTARHYLRRRVAFFFFSMERISFWKKFFNIERKQWKLLQSQVELVRINFRFEALILEEQIIPNIIY